VKLDAERGPRPASGDADPIDRDEPEAQAFESAAPEASESARSEAAAASAP
jgi:hypothetical protein